MLASGAKGIDFKKPWALYGSLKPSEQDSGAVVLIPVTSEKSFLELLETTGQAKPTKDGDLYVIQPPNLPIAAIYLRFVDGYACAAAPGKNALSKEELIPPSVIFAKPISGSLDMRLRIDQIPDQYKQLLLGSAEMQLANAQDQKIEGENDAARKGRLLGIKTFGQMLTGVVKDGAQVSIDVNISREKEGFGLAFGFGAKPGTDLAKRFGALTKGDSLFAGLAKSASPLSFVVHAPLGEAAQKVLETAFNDILADAAKKGPQEKALSEKLKEVLTPTIHAGVVDAGFDWRGPTAAGHYTLIAGVRVADGDKIESLVKELVGQAPEKDRAHIKFDASSLGEWKVHKLDVASTYDKNTRQLLGDNPIYFSFRKDAVFLALGDNGLGALGEALQAAAGKTSALAGRLHLKGLVPLMKDDPRAEGFAKDAFVKAGDDAVTFTVTGGESLQIHLEASGPVLKFLAAMGNKK